MVDQEPASRSPSPQPQTPLQDARPYGAGLKRKRITFIPASTSTSLITAEESLQDRKKAAAQSYSRILGLEPSSTSLSKQEEDRLCLVCKLPITTATMHTHEALLAHQLSLPHVHPPSHLDRQRMSVRYMEANGWDPDARQGLGPRGEGMRAPIRVVEKHDTIALGADVLSAGAGKTGKVVKKKKLGAKQVRLLAEKERKEKQRLGDRLFGNGAEVERILYGT